jgi:hypothetical protein
MAAPSDKTCSICLQIITDKKAYRSLSTEASKVYKNILNEIRINNSGYACKFCVNKLNRVLRLDEEIQGKVEVLKCKRLGLIEQLSKGSGVVTPLHGKFITPVKSTITKKRPLVSTPTPKKTKCRKILPFPSPSGRLKSPIKSCGPVSENTSKNSSLPIAKKSSKDESTQTHQAEEKEFDVKVRKTLIYIQDSK